MLSLAPRHYVWRQREAEETTRPPCFAPYTLSPPAAARVMLGAGGAVRYSVCDTTVHDDLNADGGKFGYLD